MGGYLDEYGVADARRGRFVKRALLFGFTFAVVATVAYFSLRTFSQERAVKSFLQALQQKNYQEAYRMWGCTAETPCKFYPPDKFNQDWGPDGMYKNASGITITNVDYCDPGVVFTTNLADSNVRGGMVGLWVERADNVISFAPWSRCPGRHLQLGNFWRGLFS